MAIFRPGQRHRYHGLLKRRGGKRAVTAMLSLTAMVDMFITGRIFKRHQRLQAFLKEIIL